MPIFLIGRLKRASVNFGTMLQLSLEVSPVGHRHIHGIIHISGWGAVHAVTLLTGSFAVKQVLYLFLD